MKKELKSKAKIKRRVMKRWDNNKNTHSKMITRSKAERNVVRVFNKENLIKAAKHAEDTEKNRSVYIDVLEKHVAKQPDDTMYPIVFDMIHNDIEFRLQIEIAQDLTIWLDVDIQKLDRWTEWYDTK